MTQRDSIVTPPSNTSRDRRAEFLTTYRMPLVVMAHAGIFTVALFAAFLLAYNFRMAVRIRTVDYPWFASLFVPLVLLSVPVKLIVFHATGMYRGSWRYVGLRDLFDVIRAGLTGSFFFLLFYFLLEIGSNILFNEKLVDKSTSPLRQSSVFFLDWGCTVIFVAATRILVRFYYEDIQPTRSGNPTRVLIIGAGDAGEAVLRELLRMRQERYECVGFLDDDIHRLHGRIHGVEILGGTEVVREVCIERGVQEAFIALPQATPRTIRALVERCQGTGVHFRTIPAVTDLIEGRVQVKEIRDVEIADLLGRDPVQLDADEIGRQLGSKCIVVTGAGGSIGSEMCRQIAAFNPRRLVLIEQAENALFEIERQLHALFPKLDVAPYIADVADRVRLKQVFERESPSTVFHAAAHKHVPMMERNPGEAIKNNIGGTVIVADSAVETGVEKMVLISTDKAVNPTSMMGCTKRVTETYVQAISRPKSTQFVTVRFGNVLASSGSVVPIFRDQIAKGGPVTVTHPEMKRYFMTITEAAQLVLQAGAMGMGGEIYVLHMGEPVKIVQLAKDMITLSGLRPDIDIEIAFSGVRPGEKLFEELSMEDEHIGDTAHPKIGIWKHRRDDPQAIINGVERLRQMADTGTDEDIQAQLKGLVPEYAPNEAATEQPVG